VRLGIIDLSACYCLLRPRYPSGTWLAIDVVISAYRCNSYPWLCVDHDLDLYAKLLVDIVAPSHLTVDSWQLCEDICYRITAFIYVLSLI